MFSYKPPSFRILFRCLQCVLGDTRGNLLTRFELQARFRETLVDKEDIQNYFFRETVQYLIQWKVPH